MNQRVATPFSAQSTVEVPAGVDLMVNVGSGTSLVGVPGFAGYVPAKHGVAGLTKAAALDYGALGIRVNTVAAGLVETLLVATGRSPETMAARIAQHPLGRISRPGEIADAIVWLCSGQSGFATGAVIPVDGGYTVQPHRTHRKHGPGGFGLRGVSARARRSPPST